jgi:hypothetical protein
LETTANLLHSILKRQVLERNFGLQLRNADKLHVITCLKSLNTGIYNTLELWVPASSVVLDLYPACLLDGNGRRNFSLDV